jgi:Glycosyl transferase WecG/TagA/CpsF family
MHEHKSRLRVPVMVSVGAAFDLLSGRRKQAPRWMREHGLEWSFRLVQEPGRLWRRYLVYGAQFGVYVALESFCGKNFDVEDVQARNRVSGKESRDRLSPGTEVPHSADSLPLDSAQGRRNGGFWGME